MHIMDYGYRDNILTLSCFTEFTEKSSITGRDGARWEIFFYYTTYVTPRNLHGLINY